MDGKKACAPTETSRLITVGKVVRFFCLFVLVYGLLMAAWPAVGAVYSGLYRATGTFLFGFVPSPAVVTFSRSGGSADVICITALNRDRTNDKGEVTGGQLTHNVRYIDYMHTAFLTALIAAAPLPLRRRAWALLWGMILMHVVLILRLAALVLLLFDSKLVSLLTLNPFWRETLVMVNRIFVQHLAVGFIIAFFIWVLVSFRRRDWPMMAP
jgi:hypothetical protein